MQASNSISVNIPSTSDLRSFGMPMPGRSYTSESYRFGFNGMEKDDELKGSGNSLDFGARIYDSRLGRWLSVDPLFELKPDWTPYRFGFNSPIYFKDEDGNYEVSEQFKEDYPMITKYLAENVADDILTNPLIMEALGIHSTSKQQLQIFDGSVILNETRIKDFVNWESGPIIEARDKIGGFFEIENGIAYTESSDEIEINTKALKAVESILGNENVTTEQKQKALNAFYTLLLHETVHAGDLLDGLLKEGEAGIDFENDIFDGYQEKFIIFDENNNVKEEWEIDKNIPSSITKKDNDGNTNDLTPTLPSSSNSKKGKND